MRVLITGASQGIGRSIAQVLAGPGVSLALSASKNASGLADVARMARERGAEVTTSLGDLADPDVPADLVRDATTAFGGLDAVVANAAVAGLGPLERQELEAWDRIYAIDVRATWLLAIAALPHLERSHGSIVVVSSISGLVPHLGTGAYSSAKAAVNMLVRQMAVEWGPRGVRVNAVSPGFVETPRTAGLYAPEGLGRQRVENVPLRRIADPTADIAGVVQFLLGPSAGYCTGQNIAVDGGAVDSVFTHDLPTAGSLLHDA